MPFTLAHPTAALPFARGRLVTSAIVAGTLAPDVFYYLPSSGISALLAGRETHTLAGALTVDLLVGLLLTALWRIVLRRPWLALLPTPLDGAALAQTGPAVVRRGRVPLDAVLLVASVLLGIVTHLALDLLSHESPGWGAWTDLLDRPVGGGLAVRDVSQTLLSVLGLGLLAWWVARWSRRHRGRQPLTWSPLAVAVLGATAAAALVGGVWRADPAGISWTASQATRGAVGFLLGAGSGAAAVLLGYAVAWWAVTAISRRPRRPAEPATSPAAPPRSRTPG